MSDVTVAALLVGLAISFFVPLPKGLHMGRYRDGIKSLLTIAFVLIPQLVVNACRGKSDRIE